MTEEQVTKAIVRKLIGEGWIILAYDFPQSGTGRCLHPDYSDSKTKGIWVPDIVAHRGESLVFFENKSRFVHDDFEKLKVIRETTSYDAAIKQLAEGYCWSSVYYGVGFANDEAEVSKAMPYIGIVDFVLLVDENGYQPLHDPYKLFV